MWLYLFCISGWYQDTTRGCYTIFKRNAGLFIASLFSDLMSIYIKLNRFSSLTASGCPRADDLWKNSKSQRYFAPWRRILPFLFEQLSAIRCTLSVASHLFGSVALIPGINGYLFLLVGLQSSWSFKSFDILPSVWGDFFYDLQ